MRISRSTSSRTILPARSSTFRRARTTMIVRNDTEQFKCPGNVRSRQNPDTSTCRWRISSAPPTSGVAVVVLPRRPPHVQHRHLITVADRDADDQIVVVNAAGTTAGQVARIHRALDQRGMLFHLNETLEATLEGRNTLLRGSRVDQERVRERRLRHGAQDHRRGREALARARTADLATLVVVARGLARHDRRRAEQGRRCAALLPRSLRFNPAWAIDKKLPSPRVRSIILNAHREVTETGTLQDDHRARSRGRDDRRQRTEERGREDQAAGRLSPRSDLGRGQEDATPRSSISPTARATRSTSTLATRRSTRQGGEARRRESSRRRPAQRLERARALSKLTGSNRFLMVEGATEDHVNVRLYDISLKKVSKTFSLDGSASSAAIVRESKRRSRAVPARRCRRSTMAKAVKTITNRTGIRTGTGMPARP